MTPAARIQAAIEILDAVQAGEPAEKALTGWARRSRFAGSGDRNAVRDLVFGALRRRRSWGWLGGGDDGRALMIGRLREAGEPLGQVFTGEGHAPAVLSGDEAAEPRPLGEAPRGVRLDLPDWLLPLIDESLGADSDAVLAALQDRAPVFVRANAARIGTMDLAQMLAGEGLDARPHPLARHALEVTGQPRRLAASAAHAAGLFELQDAASQAVVERLAPLVAGAEVLDYCAGGGGKTLALAALGAARVTAHDAHPARMRDLPARAARAGVDIRVTERATGRFDLVLCDAPCSGSGAWRRQPEARWRLTPAALAALNATQDAILAAARAHVRPGGHLAYATCSLLDCENGARADAFLAASPGWQETDRARWTPLDGGDGFFLAVFRAPDDAAADHR